MTTKFDSSGNHGFRQNALALDWLSLAAVGLVLGAILGIVAPSPQVNAVSVALVSAFVVPVLIKLAAFAWKVSTGSYKLVLVIATTGFCLILLLIGDLVKRLVVAPLYLGQEPLKYALFKASTPGHKPPQAPLPDTRGQDQMITKADASRSTEPAFVTSTKKVGLFAGIGFHPTGADFKALLDDGSLVPGLTYATIEVTAQDAADQQVMTTLMQGACIEEGWPQGVTEQFTFKKTTIRGLPVMIIYPASAELLDPLTTTSPAAGSKVAEKPLDEETRQKIRDDFAKAQEAAEQKVIEQIVKDRQRTRSNENPLFLASFAYGAYRQSPDAQHFVEQSALNEVAARHGISTAQIQRIVAEGKK